VRQEIDDACVAELLGIEEDVLEREIADMQVGEAAFAATAAAATARDLQRALDASNPTASKSEVRLAHLSLEFRSPLRG
jgi:hypothetical protein